MDPLAAAIMASVGSVLASTGFWTYMQKRDVRKGATTQLLLGLAHDRIIFLGMGYLERGWLSKDEYEDYMKYLVKPYSAFGGNGLAEKVVEDVKKLPIQRSNQTYTAEVPVVRK